jgi:hypothetical protein
MKVIQAKVAGEVITAPPTEEAPEMDLADAIMASINAEQAKKQAAEVV